MNLRQAYELQKLSGAFFSMDVLLLGNNVWVRSYLPIMAFTFITQYFVTDAVQSLLYLVTLPVLFFLIQKAGEHVALRRFDLKVLESCWWSVWWRATLYTIAIGLVLVITVTLIMYPLIKDLDLDSLTAEELAKEISARDPLNMGVDSAILLFLLYVIGSFLAVGYATLRAFRVSCIRTHQCPRHVGIEQIHEEEERDESEEPDRSIHSEGVAVPERASGDSSRYGPRAGYGSRERPVAEADRPEAAMNESAPAQPASEHLRRYMPPAMRSKEHCDTYNTTPAQPTDLVGAAPGAGKPPAFLQDPRNINESDEDDPEDTEEN